MYVMYIIKNGKILSQQKKMEPDNMGTKFTPNFQLVDKTIRVMNSYWRFQFNSGVNPKI